MKSQRQSAARRPTSDAPPAGTITAVSRGNWRGVALCVVLAAGLGAAAAADSSATGTSNLADLSIEDLLNVPVTSVSKKEQKISQAPAAIYVVTQEDVRRSGANSVPEALRMVPGLEVAQVDANKWAITSRGFNGLFADKLLVLVDGRSVYTSLYGGVHWDTQDIMLEDLDRIEVIRGPGGTLWGANAVNGVINIITKSAKETQGTLVYGGSGTELLAFGGVRYGGKINDDLHYRVYAKYQNHDDFLDARGRDADDEWDLFRTGFRLDWDISRAARLTLQGDYYTGHVNGRFPTNEFDLTQQTPWPEDLSGGDVQAHFTQTLSDTSSLELRAYYDRVSREGPVNDEIIDTFDLDAQHRFAFWNRNDVVWGAGYRLISDHDLGGNFATFSPRSANRQVFSAFAQDEITLVEDRLKLTLGSKMEHNDYTGFEFQPSGRLLFTPDEKNSFWGSISRAIRTPSRYERDIHFVVGSMPGGGFIPPSQVEISGSPRQKSEELLAYELGYRTQPFHHLSLDVAGFYGDYDNLRTAEAGTPAFVPTPAPHVVAPVTFDNKMRGQTYGAELAANWKVMDWWRLAGSYTWLKVNLQNDGSASPDYATEHTAPQNQFSLRSYWDLPYHFQFDGAAYYVDNVPQYRTSAFTRLDLRLGWQPTKNLDVSFGVQNLLDDRHPEVGPSFGVQPTQVQRSFWGKITWHF